MGEWDVEAQTPGGSSPLGGATRTLRRALTRRSRVVFTLITCAAIVFYLGAPWHERGGVGVGVDEEVWESPSADVYVVDEHGDHYYPHRGEEGIAPMHPRASSLVSPALLFPEVDGRFLRPPPQGAYPDSELDMIISAPHDEKPRPDTYGVLEKDSYAQTWQPPDDWQAARGAGDMEKVQWPGFADRQETKEEKRLREDRREAVKRGFMWAWQKYKDNAWGFDEVQPVTKQKRNPFNTWGSSIVDTLDTLLLMGLEDEYNLCRPHVNQLNFHWISGKDWSQGYISPASEVNDKGERWMVGRDRTATIPVFETGIRYLGGLVGAYDLSGDKLMLERAVDLADILGKAFNTRSGLPVGRLDAGAESGVYTMGSVSIAEVGSMSLELIRLSQATGNRTWFDLAQRCTDYLDEKVTSRSIHPPLIPTSFASEGKGNMTGLFSFGGMADSYYEYLIKAYRLLGGGKIAQQYKRMYADSMDTARELIFSDVTVVPGHDLSTIGQYQHTRFTARLEHLTCFAGAMLGLGAKLLGRSDDMTFAERFTATCYWVSASTKTGVQPEDVTFYANDNEKRYENLTMTGRVYHPPVGEIDELHMDNQKIRKGWDGKFRFIDDNTLVEEDSGREPGKPLEYYQRLKGKIPGTERMSGWYINRPETIESVFYMYRLTGDKKWQEKGWDMFAKWMAAGKVDGGISSIQDVNRDKHYGDNMESFIFAETFKYHYLLHADHDLMSLDDYVLNTEAHPFIATDMTPGSQGLWRGTSDANLGVRGQGTDAQKWVRREHLAKFRPKAGNGRTLGGKPRPPPANAGGGQGGGRGMGGGYVRT